MPAGTSRAARSAAGQQVDRVADFRLLVRGQDGVNLRSLIGANRFDLSLRAG